MNVPFRVAAVLVFSFAFLVPSVEATGVNDKAPTFELENISGGKAGLKIPGSRVTFVNFWASWCAPCAVEFPNLNKLAADYKDKEVAVYAINIDKERSAAEKFLMRFAREGLALTVLLDPRARTAAAYAASAMPSSYIVDEKGKVRFVHIGFRGDDPEQWRRQIDSLLNAAK